MHVGFPQNNGIESFVVHIGQRKTKHRYKVTVTLELLPLFTGVSDTLNINVINDTYRVLLAGLL